MRGKMKNKNAFWPAALIIVMALFVAPRDAFGQGATSVTGAGAATFATGSGATFPAELGATLPGATVSNPVTLSGLEFAIGIDIGLDGSVDGDLQITLVGTSAGQPKRIVVEGRVSGQAVQALSTVTFSGTCSIDMGDGTPSVSDVPIRMSVIAGESSKLTLVLGLTNLPSATVNKGSLRIK
jgi:hypothetical protein